MKKNKRKRWNWYQIGLWWNICDPFLWSFLFFLTTSDCTQPLQRCSCDDKAWEAIKHLCLILSLLFLLCLLCFVLFYHLPMYSLYSLSSHQKVYKSFLDSTHIFLDLDSAVYFPGHAKLRISCLPASAILLKAISCFSFNDFFLP